MVINSILAVLSVIGIGFIINFISDIRKNKNNRISFKEALDLTELPVVTFIGNEKKLNFLIDTGANNSILNESVVNSMKLNTETFEGIETNTAGGNIVLNKVVNLEIKYDDRRIYNECFLVANLDEAFSSIKGDTGVTIHGILGNKFFANHKYIIDFDALALYIK
jgi:predicted aspartyl protease